MSLNTSGPNLVEEILEDVDQNMCNEAVHIEPYSLQFFPTTSKPKKYVQKHHALSHTYKNMFLISTRPRSYVRRQWILDHHHFFHPQPLQDPRDVYKGSPGRVMGSGTCLKHKRCLMINKRLLLSEICPIITLKRCGIKTLTIMIGCFKWGNGFS